MQDEEYRGERHRRAEAAAPAEEARRRQPGERHRRQQQQREGQEAFANTERRLGAEAVHRRRAHADLRKREEGIEYVFIDELRRVKGGQKHGEHKGNHRAAAPAHAAKQGKQRRCRCGKEQQPYRHSRAAERAGAYNAFEPEQREEKIQKAPECRFLKESHESHHLTFHYSSRCAFCQSPHILKAASCGAVAHGAARKDDCL